MKFFMTAVVFVVVFSILKASEFSEEQIRMFWPLIRHEAPPPCPMNEIYRTCTGKCSDCTQRGRCIVTKCEEACDCAPRFYRVTPDGPCEPVGNCPKPECGENEAFRECGPLCETCTYTECRLIGCDHKCYCKEGYLRNKEGVCIPKGECPTRTRCSRSEEWAESGPIDEFCSSGVDKDTNDTTQDVPGCYCKEGYKRNFMGYCVNNTTCLTLKCTGEEMYHKCTPKCNTTCRNYGNTNCTEDDNCYPGCFCKPGSVMNDFRACVEVEKCSLDIDQVKVVISAPEDDTTGTTLPPTSPLTTLSEDSTSTDGTTEIMPEEEITTSVPTSEDFTSVSSTSATSVSGSTTKGKPNKKDKEIRNKETKHENIAKEKEKTKYIVEEDEEGFGNDDI